MDRPPRNSAIWAPFGLPGPRKSVILKYLDTSAKSAKMFGDIKDPQFNGEFNGVLGLVQLHTSFEKIENYCPCWGGRRLGLGGSGVYRGSRVEKIFFCPKTLFMRFLIDFERF